MRSTCRGSGILGGDSPIYWAFRRAQLLASIYPSGALATLPDSSTTTVTYTLPPGCDHVKRHIIADPGGRGGATETAAYADLAVPTAAPVNKCMIFLGGHGVGELESWWQQTPAPSAYCNSDGSSIILRMLADGWHVLCVDLPNYGIQPQPQIVYSAGSPVSYTHETSHPYSALFSDGGPSPNRLFLDHIVRAMNQITVTYGISHFGLVGHSGGANVAAMLAAVDSRFSAVHLLAPGTFNGANSSSDIEGWAGNPAIVAAGGHIVDMVRVAAAVPRRKTVVHLSASDPYFSADYPLWAAWAPTALSYFSGPAMGGCLSFQPNTSNEAGDYHAPNPTQAAFVEAHLLANV